MPNPFNGVGIHTWPNGM